MVTNEDELLKILQAHGEQFLGSFSLPQQTCNSRKRKRNPEIDSTQEKSWTLAVDENEDDDEEWKGIIGHSGVNTDKDLDLRLEMEGELEHDDDLSIGSSSISRTNVVIFNDFSSNPKISDTTSKSVMKAFMSSKISKLRQDVPGLSNSKETGVGVDDERSNAENDALLHRLVHTELLSGFHPELDPSAPQRRKALAGRILELSGDAKLGKGQKSVTEMERNKASKRVRHGLIEKQKARVEQKLEEAKNLGNYHPTIKKLFGPSAGPAKARRDRGLKMGVGKFSGGLLKLSRKDVSLAQGGEQSSDRGRHNRGRRKTK